MLELAVAFALAAPTLPAFPTFDYAGRKALVACYWAGIAANDADRIVEPLAEDVVVRDPTVAVLTGQPLELKGRKTLHDWYAPLSKSARKVDLKIVDAVYAGDVAVVRSVQTVETAGAAALHPEIPWVTLTYRTTSVFTFAGGRIASITDYGDYEAVKSQITGAR